MFEVIDNENGRKWVYHKSRGKCFVRYYEFFKALGWRVYGEPEQIPQEDYTAALLESTRN